MRALADQPDLKTGLQASEVQRVEAEAAKERGNDAFKAKDFSAAIQHYDTAIIADNTNAAYYSNRCVHFWGACSFFGITPGTSTPDVML